MVASMSPSVNRQTVLPPSSVSSESRGRIPAAGAERRRDGLGVGGVGRAEDDPGVVAGLGVAKRAGVLVVDRGDDGGEAAVEIGARAAVAPASALSRP